MDFNNEYSEKFDELRKNRVRVSFHKYGSAADNFGKGFVQAIPTLEKCLDKYKVTGNTEICVIWRTMPCLNSCIHSTRKGIFGQQTAGKVQGLLG